MLAGRLSLQRGLARASDTGQSNAVSRHGAAEISDLQAGRSKHSRDQDGGDAIAAGAASREDDYPSQPDSRNENEDFEPHPEYGTDQKCQENGR